MGWLVCGLSTARPVMRGPVVRTLYKESSSPSQTLRILLRSHTVFLERFFLRSVIGILIKPVSSKGRLGEDLEIKGRSLSCRSSSIPHQEDRSWIPNQVCNFSFFSPLK